MNDIKRSLKTSLAHRYNVKVKDISKSFPPSSQNKLSETPLSESIEPYVTPTFPVIKQIDNSLILPRYTTVLGRSPEDGVLIDDIDQLQTELEELLSTCTIKHTLLRSEIESIESVEERRKRKRGQPNEKHQLQKSKRVEDKQKNSNFRNGNHFVKSKHNVLLNNYINDLSLKREVPKVISPKIDTSDKFWLSIEPYCCDVTKDDVVFLDDLIQECSQNIDIKIPEIGEHYTCEWTNDLLEHEKSLSNNDRSGTPKSVNCNSVLKKNGINTMVDTFSSSLSEHLLVAMIKEKVGTKIRAQQYVNKDTTIKTTDDCMEHRFRRELIEAGIFDGEDLPSSAPTEDNILIEMKKCMAELTTVNEKNVEELNKLQTIITMDLRRQEVKELLTKIENQVMEMYNKIIMNVQKQNTQGDDDGYETHNCSKQILKEYNNEANRLIQQQVLLNNELTELTNSTMQF